MSKYTMTIKEAIESIKLATYTGLDDPVLVLQNLSKSDIMEIGATLFPQTFDFYTDDTDDIAKFKNEFIQHFYFYEIGQETLAQFKWYLEDYLNTRMPYYKQLYESQLDGLAEAFNNFDFENKFVSSGTITKAGTTSRADAEARTIDKDTLTQRDIADATNDDTTQISKQYPINNTELQELGRNIDTSSHTQRMDDDTTYAEDVTDNRTLNSSENTSENNTTQEISTRTMKGTYEIDKVKRTKEYRQLLFSINELIFNDMLEYSLFMKIW